MNMKLNLIDSLDLNRYKVLCNDGELGRIKDFYFDEDWYFLRYLVIDTSSFLNRKLVLVSPISFKRLDLNSHVLHLDLSKKELEESPSFDSQETVSMKFEKAYHHHFSWPYHGKNHLTPWAIGPYGAPWPYYESENDIANFDVDKQTQTLIDEAKQAKLWSAKEVTSFGASSFESNGKIKRFGHIQGFVINTSIFSLDYFIVDTKNYWPSKLVALKTEWVRKISWKSKEVSFYIAKDLIKSAPSYHRDKLNSKYFEQSNEYFGNSNKRTIDRTQVYRWRPGS